MGQAPLPWATIGAVFWAAIAATIAGLFDPFAVGGPWGVCTVLGFSLLGMGMTLADHVLPRLRRWQRWALGAAATGLLPLGPVASALGISPPQYRNPPVFAANWLCEAATMILLLGGLGALLGAAARRGSGRYWRLPLASLVAHVVLGALMVLAPQLAGNALGVRFEPARLAGATPFTTVLVFSPLLGLALAYGLQRAEEAEGSAVPLGTL